MHRPRYDDWSFAKGKLDAGETALAAAVREVQEETALTVRLGPRLPDQRYTVAGGQPKVVTYWSARANDGSSMDAFEANAEVDKLRWVPVAEASRALSYPRDQTLLERFTGAGYDTEPLLVVRHAEACKRSAWRGADSARPLRDSGKEQARRLLPLLTAYGVSGVVSSDATRCVQTMRPYVEVSGVKLTTASELSEEGYDEKRFAKLVRRLLSKAQPVAVCTHRPQLHPLFEVAGVEPIGLMPAEVVVLHRRNGKVVDVEQHAV